MRKRGSVGGGGGKGWGGGKRGGRGGVEGVGGNLFCGVGEGVAVRLDLFPFLSMKKSLIDEKDFSFLYKVVYIGGVCCESMTNVIKGGFLEREKGDGGWVVL